MLSAIVERTETKKKSDFGKYLQTGALQQGQFANAIVQLQLFWEIWTHFWSSKLAFDEKTSSCDFPFDGTRPQKRTHFFSIALLFCWIWRVGKTSCNVRKYDDIYLNSHWLLAQRYRMLSVLKIKIRAKWTKIEAQTFFLKFWIITRGELLLFKHRKPVFKRFLKRRSRNSIYRFVISLRTLCYGSAETLWISFEKIS